MRLAPNFIGEVAALDFDEDDDTHTIGSLSVGINCQIISCPCSAPSSIAPNSLSILCVKPPR
jgi:hypothetical protein